MGVQSENYIQKRIDLYVRQTRDPITLYVKKENNYLIFVNLDDMMPPKDDLPIKIRKYAKRKRVEDMFPFLQEAKKCKPVVTGQPGDPGIIYNGHTYYCKTMQSLMEKKTLEEAKAIHKQPGCYYCLRLCWDLTDYDEKKISLTEEERQKISDELDQF